MKVKALVEVNTLIEVEKEFDVTEDAYNVAIENAQAQIANDYKSDDFNYQIVKLSVTNVKARVIYNE